MVVKGCAAGKGRKNIFPVYYRRPAIGFRCLNNLPACGGDGGSDVQPLEPYTNKRVRAAITSPLPKSPCKKTLRVKRGVDKKIKERQNAEQRERINREKETKKITRKESEGEKERDGKKERMTK